MVVGLCGVVALFSWAVRRDVLLSPLPSPPALTDTVALEDGPTMAPAPGIERERDFPVFPAALASRGSLVTGFVVQDDPRSLQRLTEVGEAMDIVFPDYFRFDVGDGTIEISVSRGVPAKLNATGAMIFPRISNLSAEGVWESEAVSNLLRSSRAQRAFIDTLCGELAARGATGVNIDIEALEPADSSRYLEFLSLLREALHRNKLYLTVDVPLGEEQYDYEAIAKISDALVLMAYDQHYASGAPGPIAGLEWFSDGIKQYLARLPAEKVIVAIGAYAYDWPATGPAEALAFDEAMALGVKHRASVLTAQDSVNSTFKYRDADNVEHHVFLLDAVSAWNQIALLADDVALGLQGKTLGGVGVWRLGLDDPGIWPLMTRGLSGDMDIDAIKTVPTHDVPMLRGRGELFRVRSSGSGSRAILQTGQYINYAEYRELPEPTTIDKLGPPPDDGQPPLVALTFDDGPSPIYTNQLLDLFEKEKVPAAFFVVGSEVKLHPEVVRRQVALGHLVGNHTYLHPHLETITPERLGQELNATERIIESVTGRQTLLFRSPYDVDSNPTDAGRLAAFAQVSSRGYLCVGANIGAEDYWPTLTPERIARQVLDQLDGPGPFVICLHDGGGDRSRTVAAVASLIPQIRARGMQLVSLSEISGLKAAALNPPVPPGEKLAVRGDQTFSLTGSLVLKAVSWVFLVSTIIAMVRIVGLGVVLIFDRKIRRQREEWPRCVEPVTVLVPAYNEGKVVARTVEAILHSTHPDVRVLVIDDGSTDDTADVALAFAARDPRVQLLRKPNGGKADALNVGFAAAQTDLVVVIDADTIILPSTIANLVAPFVDPSIHAVCGNVQVGNVVNFLTAIQDVEYVTCQNYDRRAFDALNCIGVVPGATGAWRRHVVVDAGGYSHDTLTEDADLTIAVLRNGGRIVYAPDAKSVTEVPSTFRTLYRQRFRWAYGTFQTLWKHRSAFGRGTLGWIGMPNHMIFQVLFPMLAPIGDIVLLYSIATGQWSAVASGYLMFIGMDLLGSGIALKLDKRPLAGLWTVFVQRFCHRQFMYYVTFAAAIACLRGRRHGWNKLERQATVKVPQRLGGAGASLSARPAERPEHDQAMEAG